MPLLSLFRRTSVTLGILLAAVVSVVPAAMAQTNPPAQSLPYSQNFASLTPATVTTLPAGWVGWQVGAAAGHFDLSHFGALQQVRDDREILPNGVRYVRERLLLGCALRPAARQAGY